MDERKKDHLADRGQMLGQRLNEKSAQGKKNQFLKGRGGGLCSKEAEGESAPIFSQRVDPLFPTGGKLRDSGESHERFDYKKDANPLLSLLEEE